MSDKYHDHGCIFDLSAFCNSSRRLLNKISALLAVINQLITVKQNNSLPLVLYNNKQYKVVQAVFEILPAGNSYLFFIWECSSLTQTEWSKLLTQCAIGFNSAVANFQWSITAGTKCTDVNLRISSSCFLILVCWRRLHINGRIVLERRHRRLITI